MDDQLEEAGVAPPWRLAGEAVVALARIPAQGSPRLPDGVVPMPGPALLLAVQWERSPMGGYRELTIGSPARIGLWPGLSITTMVVDSAASCRAGRANWGLPKEVGRLTWRPADPAPDLRWEDRGIEVRARTVGPARAALPIWAPVPLLQRRADGPVVVPGRARARARPALVDVTAPDGDPLYPWVGRHPGALLPAVDLWLGAARRS